MSPSSAEELRFNFGEVVVEDEAAEERPRPAPKKEAADEVRSTLPDLKSRVAEVRAAAQGASRTPVLLRPGNLARDEEPFPVELAPQESLHPASEEPSPGLPESLSIAQFYERVRRALALEFADEVWVTGEIRGLREARGHHYLELADHGAPAVGRGAGQALEVVCWAREWPPVARALAEAGLTLEVGQVVRVRGKVSVWEGGSKIRFTLTALDVEALLGQIAQARRRLLLALEAEGLLEANKRWPLALVPLRIGLVTSQSSEAHRDFVGQLQASGFAFQIRLEASLVQGSEAPGQLVAAIRRLETFEPDLAVIVRGGGARGDLAAFDNEAVARAVANASFPIWTGIGHTGDRSVVDEIAHGAFITPTACGEAIVARVSAYWSEINRKTKELSALAMARLDTAQRHLSAMERTIVRGTRHQLSRHDAGLQSARERVSRAASSHLSSERVSLLDQVRVIRSSSRRLIEQRGGDVDRCLQVVRAYDPQRQLARGWSLTSDETGRIVRSLAQLRVGNRLRTQFHDGEASSVIEELMAMPEDSTGQDAEGTA